jgi:hypothetical protein
MSYPPSALSSVVDTLVIDNYDSFTYNIVQYLEELGASVTVIRNDACSIEDIERFNPRRIVISPGPGAPRSAGISMSVITHFAGQNGQVENIGNGGFCVNSVDDYHKCMHYLSNKDNLKILSDNAKKFAMENYEQNFVVRAIKNFYNEIIEQKGIFNEKDNRF